LIADIVIIGAPHGTPYTLNETNPCAQAPSALRVSSAKYAGRLTHWDFDLNGRLLDDKKFRIVDCGDVFGDPSDPVGNCKRITDAIKMILQKKVIPIVLGGDDSIPIPFFRAYEDFSPIHLIQIDAHLDWRHEINGIAEGFSSTMRRASEMPWIGKMIQVGLRGIGSAREEELQAAKEYGALLFTAREIFNEGIAHVLDTIEEGSNCLITIDCDGLDPAIMPAVRAPAPGGLTYYQIIELLHRLAQKAHILGLDLVEFAPKQDVNGIGALTAVRVVWNMIGALVRSPYLIERIQTD
jgi:agmatinase